MKLNWIAQIAGFMIGSAASAQTITCNQIGQFINCYSIPLPMATIPNVTTQDMLDVATMAKPFEALEAGMRARDEEILRQQQTELNRRALEPQ